MTYTPCLSFQLRLNCYALKIDKVSHQTMETKKILDLAISALENVKAEHITVINVEHLTELMSYVVVCTANSGTHAKALANNVEMTAKKKNVNILGIEGEVKSDWVLVDLVDVVIHIMKEETREFYQLEKLWDIKPNSPKERQIHPAALSPCEF